MPQKKELVIDYALYNREIREASTNGFIEGFENFYNCLRKLLEGTPIEDLGYDSDDLCLQRIQDIQKRLKLR